MLEDVLLRVGRGRLGVGTPAVLVPHPRRGVHRVPHRRHRARARVHRRHPRAETVGDGDDLRPDVPEGGLGRAGCLVLALALALVLVLGTFALPACRDDDLSGACERVQGGPRRRADDDGGSSLQA